MKWFEKFAIWYEKIALWVFPPSDDLEDWQHSDYEVQDDNRK